MTVHELNLAALMHDLDGGRIGEAFAQELKRVALDCDDRPTDNKPRKVTLEAVLVPIPQDGALDSVAAKFQVTSSVPKRRSKQYNLGFRHGGKLVFNDLSEENIHQATFDVDDDDE